MAASPAYKVCLGMPAVRVAIEILPIPQVTAPEALPVKRPLWTLPGPCGPANAEA